MPSLEHDHGHTILLNPIQGAQDLVQRLFELKQLVQC